MQLKNSKILVTGGASGIGLGLTARLLREGSTVIACGRREAILREAADRFPSLITRSCDLSLEEERRALYEWVSIEHPDLDVLINNAGIQQWMNVTDADFYDRAKAELAINVEAPLHLTALFIQLESLRTIVNVSSGLAFVPLTRVPVYSATKAFLHSFTMSARHLLAERGIEVIEMIPPALNTDLGGKGLHDNAPPVGEFIEAIFSQLAGGSTELTHGFSEAMRRAGPAELQAAFERLNPR